MNESIRTMNALLKCTAALLATTVMAACSSSGSVDDGSLIVEATGDAQSIQLTPPAMLLNRAINPGTLFNTVTLNGSVFNLSQLPGGNGTVWQGTTQVEQGDDVELRVEWFEFFNGRELLLAVAEETYTSVAGNTNVVLREDDYEIDDITRFPRLDDDNDRVPNLAERVEGSDPLSATDPGLFRANAFIQQIDPSRAPVIDGSFDLIWGEAQYRDRDAELLFMDNRMMGFDPDRPEGNTEYRWGGLHDGQFLYLYVLGESSARRNSHGDSLQPWQDDAIDIFWDGNRSQGSTYDGVDDYHLIIPLLKLDQNTRNQSHLDEDTLDPEGRAETGFNSRAIEDLDGVMFANCVCPSSDTYEIRLDMEKLGIPLDRSFGFDLQINNDIDGDTREFKFGWEAPSAAENVFEEDLTWEDPSRMGLLHLLPE